LSVPLSVAVVVLLSSFALAQSDLDDQLTTLLTAAGFSGRIESTLEARLGRPLNPRLSDLGRDL